MGADTVAQWAPLGVDYVPPQPAPAPAPVNHVDAIYALYRMQNPEEPSFYYCNERIDTLALCAQLAASERFAPETQFTPHYGWDVRVSVGARRLEPEEHDVWVARAIKCMHSDTTERPPVRRFVWVMCALMLYVIAFGVASTVLLIEGRARCYGIASNVAAPLAEADLDPNGLTIATHIVGNATLYRAEPIVVELATVCNNIGLLFFVATVAFTVIGSIGFAHAMFHWAGFHAEMRRACVRAWAQRVIAAHAAV